METVGRTILIMAQMHESQVLLFLLFSHHCLSFLCVQHSLCVLSWFSTCFWQKQTLSLIDSYLTAVLCNACIPSSRLVTTQLLDVWPLQWHCIQLLKRKVWNLAVVWALVHLLQYVSFKWYMMGDSFCYPWWCFCHLLYFQATQHPGISYLLTTV